MERWRVKREDGFATKIELHKSIDQFGEALLCSKCYVQSPAESRFVSLQCSS